jgi:hypothetical protein
VSDFDDLVDEAERASIDVWDFGWLDGRAVEDRPTCGTSTEWAKARGSGGRRSRPCCGPVGPTSRSTSAPQSLRLLSEFLMGPLPDTSKRDTEFERRAAEAADLIVRNMGLEHPDVAFYDIGAVVYLLRLVPWIVPGFTVATHRECLWDLHQAIERDGVFETIESRTLVEATKPT